MTDQSRANIWVIIPAYNEATVIADVVRSVCALGYSVVVVDDCSNDGTGDAAAEAGAVVLRHIVNLGQGAALQTGFAYALERAPRCVVTFDADGQHRADEIERLVQPLLEGRVDVVLGTRFSAGGSAIAIPPFRRFLLESAVRYVRIVSRLNVTDVHNGFRAFSAEAARQLRLEHNRMAHASEVLSKIARYRWRYTEVPVTITYTGYALKKGQRVSNIFNIVWESLIGRLLR